jgi:hypothetical protein
VLGRLGGAEPWAGLQLLEAEGGFRYLKSQLLLRPVFRRLEHRIRAHVLIRGLAALRTSALRHPKRSLLQMRDRSR